MFKSKKQLAKALMKGRRFKTKMGNTLTFDDSKPNPFRLTYSSPDQQTPMDTVWNSYDTVTELPPEPECCCCKCNGCCK